jgi:nucleoside transporter
MASTSAASSSAPPLDTGLRVQLSVMMFLQFAVWGAWFVVLGNRLGAMGLTDYVGTIAGTMALGTIFTPLFIGQIADRWFSSEKLMALLHLGGAGMLYWMASIPPVPEGASAEVVAETSSYFWWVALGYALVYSPTLALANSIAFTHVPNGERDFPSIRVLGTIGWIAAGLAVGNVLTLAYDDPKTSNGPFLLAAGLSALLGLYSLALPHTPPKGQAGDAVPFLRAVGLLKEPSFAVFFGASFIITIVLAFYYNYTSLYLEKRHEVKDTASLMTIGQFSEIFFLLLLPVFLRYLGMKWVLAIGMLAWGLRYLAFAYPDPYFLVIIGLALHGICFDFFFAAGFIHVDKTAPAAIRGSAQALFTFLTYGLAMWLGSEFSNEVHKWYTVDKATDWQKFWVVPAGGVLVALTIFVLFFRMPRAAPTTPERELREASETPGV